MLQDSSESETDQGPIMTSYDTNFDSNGAGLLFHIEQKYPNLTMFHPPAVQILNLWQVFIDNVNPIVKIIHVPTSQQQIIKASNTLNTTSYAMQALMFGIYSMAVKSLENSDCLTAYHEDKQTMLSRYQFGAQQALWNAGFLRSSDITTLQALVIYLVGRCFLPDRFHVLTNTPMVALNHSASQSPGPFLPYGYSRSYST